MITQAIKLLKKQKNYIMVDEIDIGLTVATEIRLKK
jgi:hypothetical protein